MKALDWIGDPTVEVLGEQWRLCWGAHGSYPGPSCIRAFLLCLALLVILTECEQNTPLSETLQSQPCREKQTGSIYGLTVHSLKNTTFKCDTYSIRQRLTSMNLLIIMKNTSFVSSAICMCLTSKPHQQKQDLWQSGPIDSYSITWSLCPGRAGTFTAWAAGLGSFPSGKGFGF